MESSSGRALRERMRRIQAGEEPPPGIMQTLGMRLVALGEGRSRLEMDVDPGWHNPMGTLHGGIMCDLMDAAIGIATMSTLADDESFTTIEFKINFLRPVVAGRIIAEAQVINRGRRVAVLECTLTSPDGKLLAKLVGTNAILKPSP